MTEPTDETETEITPGVILPPPGPASAGGIPAPAPAPLAGDTAGDPEPDLPAAAEPLMPAVSPPLSSSAPPGVVPPAVAGTPPDGNPPLRADPNRPVSDWREPPWFPPRERRDRGPNLATIVIGVVIVAIGVYYFLAQTLQLSVPVIRWASLWPLIFILVGGLIVLRAIGRR
jgi:hypothetical protein